MGIVERRKRTNPLVWKILVALLAVTLVAGIVAVHVLAFRNRGRGPEKEQTVSVTEEVTARAYVWLQQIEDTELSYPEVRETIGDLEIQLEKDQKNPGDSAEALVLSSYEEAKQKAMQGMEKLFCRVLTERLQKSGYEGSCEPAELDRMMQDAYGVTVSEYIRQCEIPLLPTTEELQKRLEQEVAHE